MASSLHGQPLKEYNPHFPRAAMSHPLSCNHLLLPPPPSQCKLEYVCQAFSHLLRLLALYYILSVRSFKFQMLWWWVNLLPPPELEMIPHQRKFSHSLFHTHGLCFHPPHPAEAPSSIPVQLRLSQTSFRSNVTAAPVSMIMVTGDWLTLQTIWYTETKSTENNDKLWTPSSPLCIGSMALKVAGFPAELADLQCRAELGVLTYNISNTPFACFCHIPALDYSLDSAFATRQVQASPNIQRLLGARCPSLKWCNSSSSLHAHTGKFFRTPSPG